MLGIRPITLRTASAYINANHRHHRATVGCKFAITRCKDCVYYHGGYCERIAFVMNARFNGTEEVKNPDDFCSMGEAHGR